MIRCWNLHSWLFCFSAMFNNDSNVIQCGGWYSTCCCQLGILSIQIPIASSFYRDDYTWTHLSKIEVDNSVVFGYNCLELLLNYFSRYLMVPWSWGIHHFLSKWKVGLNILSCRKYFCLIEASLLRYLFSKYGVWY